MREIKFRGKQVDNGEWVYGQYASRKDGREHYIIEDLAHIDSWEWNADAEYVIPETVGQFTGLTDKNGKEIYEGDRIDEFEIIEWCTNSNGWQVALYDIPTKDKILCHCYNCEGNYDLRELVLDRSLEVIGNIHDK